jgi:hypothetical protein
VARNRLDGRIYQIYLANYGNVECHWFWSALMYEQYGRRRDNVYGPYKTEDLKDPAQTFFAGDGEVYYGPYSYYEADYAFFFMWDHIERSTCFGTIVTWTSDYRDNPPYYHTYGPQTSFWDGHVETVTPPPLSKADALLANITRDGTKNTARP